MDLRKAFDTVDHQILLAKLSHYGICGVSNDLFKSYLSNCSQYSGLAAINSGVPQGSVLPYPDIVFLRECVIMVYH